MVNNFNYLDLKLLEFIHNFSQNYIFDKIMPLITWLGNDGRVWIIIALILFFNKKYRRVGVMMVLALILVTILGEGIIKHLVQRPRPFVGMHFHLLIPKPKSYSFPSGHTSASFAAAGVIFGSLKKFRVYAIVLALLIGFSRMYLLVHYPTDVLVGMILGLICAKIILKVCENRDFKLIT